MARAERFTALNKQPIFYSDFTNNMILDNITEQLSTNINQVAVANAIKNLILTNLGERPYHPEVGSKVQSLLFEPADTLTADLIKATITSTIENCEPRAQLQDVVVTAAPDSNSFTITIIFVIINISTPATLRFILQRVR